MGYRHDTFRYPPQYKVFRRLHSARSVPLRTRPTDTRYRIEPVCTSRECLKRRGLFRHACLCSRLRGQVFRMCCSASFQKLTLPYAAWSAVGNRTQLVQSGRDRFCANSTADYLIFFHGRTQGTTVPALLCSYKTPREKNRRSIVYIYRPVG